MEQENIHFEDPETRLRDFREEMRDFVVKERKPEQGAHYPEPKDADELTPEFMEIWNKIKSEAVTREEIKYLKDNLIDETGHPREGISESLIKFMDLFNNKAGGVIMKRQMTELLRKKRQGK